MPPAVITVEDVSLKYRLFSRRGHSLKDFILARLQRRPYQNFHDLWALKHVQFTCRAGERIAIVGVNGAGKTSLLKVLAGIYPPTEGRVHCLGRVVPLLELGLGFNGDMTGIENIMLAAVLLGKTRQEARKLTPDVLAFAELADFQDVPVKYYSSGMQARLAFALALETTPDILLLDEVFAVGDIHWIQRAEQRLLSLLERTKVVLIISHNLSILKQICHRALYLDHGRLVADGDIDTVLSAYQHQAALAQSTIVDHRESSAVRLVWQVNGSQVWVTVKSIPLLGESWVGLFAPNTGRDDYLAYRRVVPGAPTATFAIATDQTYEIRAYRWTPKGEILEASTRIEPVDMSSWIEHG